MNEDRPWLGEEPTGGPDTNFPPGPTALGVFLAVAGPIVFIGIARPGGADLIVVGLGILAGIVAGIAAASWLSGRDGGAGPPAAG